MSAELAAAVRAAVQAILDAAPDAGWHCAQFVVAMGLERVTPEGGIEAIPWVWSPPEQADWMTAGLLEAAAELRVWQTEPDDD